MKENILEIKTICECNRQLGCSTLHPLVSVTHLDHPELAQQKVQFDFYAVLLVTNGLDSGCLGCGRKYYDYSYATMVFLKPGETFRLARGHALPRQGCLLTFHPSLLTSALPLNPMDNYTYFAYNKDEALHLSQREAGKVTCCLENIEDELHYAVDAHSATILSRHIELLLDYCKRYYDRQFITRENRNKTILQKLDHLLGEYIGAGKLSQGRMPVSQTFSETLGLSVAYFDDLLKFETGYTFNEFLQLRRLEAAKVLLRTEGGTPTDVARKLGYPSVEYFTVLFKKLTGVAPSRYRDACN